VPLIIYGAQVLQPSSMTKPFPGALEVVEVKIRVCHFPSRKRFIFELLTGVWLRLESLSKQFSFPKMIYFEFCNFLTQWAGKSYAGAKTLSFGAGYLRTWIPSPLLVSTLRMHKPPPA